MCEWVSEWESEWEEDDSWLWIDERSGKFFILSLVTKVSLSLLLSLSLSLSLSLLLSLSLSLSFSHFLILYLHHSLDVTMHVNKGSSTVAVPHGGKGCRCPPHKFSIMVIFFFFFGLGSLFFPFFFPWRSPCSLSFFLFCFLTLFSYALLHLLYSPPYFILTSFFFFSLSCFPWIIPSPLLISTASGFRPALCPPLRHWSIGGQVRSTTSRLGRCWKSCPLSFI